MLDPLHSDTAYPAGSAVLEVGCGVGAQTVTLAQRSPGAIHVGAFAKKTFAAMVEGIRESAISAGLIRAETFDTGVRDLYRTTESDGVFCYTFFKGVGKKRRDA